MGQVYNKRTVFSISFFLYLTLFACFGAEKTLPRAILEVGTVASAGVPGFGPNRIPCLYGRYALGDLGSVDAYAISDPVLFSAERWKRTGSGAQTRWIALAEGRRIVAGPRTIPSANPEAVPRAWHFALSFPETVDEALCLDFFALFADRVSFFFSSAKVREALSFPAVLGG